MVLALSFFFMGGLLALLALLNSYVLATLWGWFLVPFGLPAISLAHAYGLAVLFTFLFHKIEDPKDTDPTATTSDMVYKVVYAVMQVVIKGAVTILLGFVARKLM